MNLRNSKFVRYTGIFIGFSLVLNFGLAIIGKIFNVVFVPPEKLVEGPYVFSTLHIGSHSLNITQTIVNTWVLILILFLIFYYGTKNLSVDNPSKMQVILEEVYVFVENMFVSSYGTYKKMFMPFFVAMLSLIAISNLSFFLFPFVPYVTKVGSQYRVEPLFRTATADLNTTVGLAIVVFIIFMGILIKNKGIKGLLKELSHPFVIMFPVNVVGELAKPVNISVRLFGNMIAGLVILGLVYRLNIPHIVSLITGGYLSGGFSIAYIWPIFLQLYLDLFVGIIQAFVFTVLSSVYIGQSINNTMDVEEE